MNNQEIFDIAVRHLQHQKERSMGAFPDGTPCCMYRGNNGMMCAVGALIPDNVYDPAIEYTSADSLYDYIINEEHFEPDDLTQLTALNKALIASGVDTDNRDTLNLLRDLQMLHDNHMALTGWSEFTRTNAVAIAERYNLNDHALQTT